MAYPEDLEKIAKLFIELGKLIERGYTIKDLLIVRGYDIYKGNKLILRVKSSWKQKPWKDVWAIKDFERNKIYTNLSPVEASKIIRERFA